MRYITLFLLLILTLTSCSKQPVEKKVPTPLPPKKEIKGIIPETIIKKAEKKYGKYVRNRYEAYNDKLRQLQDVTEDVKLKEVNDFFNRVPYVEDIQAWGKNDYWATPLEFLGKDKGDCEDYVIAKYFSLRDLGIKSEKLYFSYVKLAGYKRTHMVLSYFKTPHSVPLVLDSKNFKIFPADKRADLTPVYNFNGESLYHVGKKGQNGHKVIDITKNEKVHRNWDRLIKDIKKDKL